MIGVYKIECISNNKVYVGSSLQCYIRWKQHLWALKSNRHINRHLQSAWNIYGEDNFRFSIIEKCLKEQLIDREQYYMNIYQSWNRTFGFNKSIAAKCKMNTKSYIVQDPNKKIYKISNLEQFCRENNLEKSGLHKVANGSSRQYKQWLCRHASDSIEEWMKKQKRKNKSGTGWKGSYEIIFDNGTKIITPTLRKFCKDNNLSLGNLHRVNKPNNKPYGIIEIRKIDNACSNSWVA